MTNIDIDNHDLIAELIIDQQYDDEIYDADSFYAYLDDSISFTLIPADLDDPRATLIDSLDADLHDLTANDALIDEEIDIALHDDTDYRRLICTKIADKLLARF